MRDLDQKVALTSALTAVVDLAAHQAGRRDLLRESIRLPAQQRESGEKPAMGFRDALRNVCAAGAVLY